MNLMDLIPVDFIPVLAGHVAYYLVGGPEHAWITSPESFYFKVVPTTDPNITLGMALAIFVLTIYYSISVKGIKAFAAELNTPPFGKWLMPVNFVLEMVNFIAKPISLGLRLFGNLYAGEMIFILIALMLFFSSTLIGCSWDWSTFSLGAFPHINCGIAGIYIYGANYCLFSNGA